MSGRYRMRVGTVLLAAGVVVGVAGMVAGGRSGEAAAQNASGQGGTGQGAAGQGAAGSGAAGPGAAGQGAAGQGGAGKDGAGKDGTTTLQVFSRLSIVDVTVTDRSGRPVQGLQRSDFSLSEDGNPQPIRDFDEITAGYVPPRPTLPPHVYTNLRPPSPSKSVNLLLLDFANEAPMDSTDQRQLGAAVQMQHYVKQAALDAIDQMPVGTQMAVLSMTNDLHILQSFTSDPEMLKAAINAAPYDLEGHAIANAGGGGGGWGSIKIPNMPSRPGGGTGDGCIQADERNRSVLESFDQIAADTAPMKVRKNLIWFTVGIPAITDPNLRPKCLPDYSLGLSQAYDLLAAAQISVYPVDARGVSRLSEAQLSMEAVAEATGGVAYSGTNDMATAVEKALENGANYYSLSYVPPSGKYDGAFHNILVKVDRPDVTVVFRKGYYSDNVAKIPMKQGLTLTMTPPPVPGGNMKAAMSRGLPTSQDLLFDVQVQPSTLPAKPGDSPVLGTLDPKLKGKRLVRYGFQYDVPAKQIAFKSGAKGLHVGQLDFDVAVYDANEKLLTGLSQTMNISLDDAHFQELMKGPVRLLQQIDLPAAGPLFVRVGVLDHTSLKAGTLELPLTVGKNRSATNQSGE